MSIVVGQPITLRAEFRDPDTQLLVDPASVTFEAHRPDGTDLPKSTTNTDVGKFKATLLTTDVTVDGLWAYKFIASTPNSVVEGTFEVVASAFSSPLEILVELDDLQSVRNVMGVSSIDVTDSMIQSNEFGWQGEYEVKRQLVNWQSILGDPDTSRMVKLAAVYAVAALICDQWAKGGTVGNTNEANERDWIKFTAEMWNFHAFWLDEAKGHEVDPSPILTFITRSEDFRAVRELLGPSFRALREEIITNTPFGEQAEQDIMDAVPDWATIWTTAQAETEPNTPLSDAFRLAAIYRTAAYLAQSYAANSMTSRSEAVRWQEWAELMFARALDQIAIIAGESTVATSGTDGFTGLVIASKSSVIKRWWGVYPPVWGADMPPQWGGPQ